MGSSLLYGGPAVHQRSGYKGIGAVNPCLPSQSSVSMNDAFNPPIATFSESYGTSRHQPEDTGRLCRDDDIRRFPGPPNDEEVSSYYTG